MNDKEVRHNVSRAYASALARAQGGAASSVPEGTYSAETAAAHPDAVASSFGCGNPLAFADVTPGQTVVDLGSGAGLDLLIAAERVGPSGRVIGIDMTDEMVEAARLRARDAGASQIEVRRGLIEALPVDDASADWVISNCVINLSPDKPAVFAEIARVLVPGGRFSVSDMVTEDLPEWIRQIAGAHAACVGGAVSEQIYVEGLVAAGLVDVTVSERHVYSADELRALLADQLEAFDLRPEMVEMGLGHVAGKVSSIRVVGRREQ